jgi:hypothetical protein
MMHTTNDSVRASPLPDFSDASPISMWRPLLTRPAGRPPKQPHRIYHSFEHRVELWDHARRVVVKIGSKVVCHARPATFPLAEVAVPRRLYRPILDRIQRCANILPTCRSQDLVCEKSRLNVVLTFGRLLILVTVRRADAMKTMAVILIVTTYHDLQAVRLQASPGDIPR